jgi:hypothetical protein
MVCHFNRNKRYLERFLRGEHPTQKEALIYAYTPVKKLNTKELT